MKRFLIATVCLSLGAPAWAQLPKALAHPSWQERAQSLGVAVEDGYRLVVFGDQKGLMKKDFPLLLRSVAARAAIAAPPLLLMVDTGDIVDQANRLWEFEFLKTQLLDRYAPRLPYLVAVGNHELEYRGRQNHREARKITAAFLASMHPDFKPDRMYYQVTIGKVRFLFLDTNSFVYADEPPLDQIEWLDAALRQEVEPTIVVMHHPFVLSAWKHREHALKLWNSEYQWDPESEAVRQSLPERLIEGGVDLVLMGHVHNYEAFVLERGQRRMLAFNLSGRPAGWYKGQRRAQDWSRRDAKRELKARGFERVEGWKTLQQLDFMSKQEEGNQYGLVTVGPEGVLGIEVFGCYDENKGDPCGTRLYPD